MRKISCWIMMILALSCQQLFAAQTLTLEESRDMALKNNYTVKNSRLEIDASLEKKKEVFTKFFPKVGAEGMIYSAEDNLLNIMDAGMLKSGTMGMLSAVQPVFAGGRIISGYRLASLGEDVSKQKSRVSENEVLFKTEEYYWQIVSLDEKMLTLGKYRDFLSRLQFQADDAFAAGLILKNDVLKVKVKVSEVLLLQAKVENGRQVALMAFCQHIGIPYDATLKLAPPPDEAVSPQAFWVHHPDALKTRLEYQLLESSVRAEELQTKIKIGEYLPQVGIGVGELYMKFDEAPLRFMGMNLGTASVTQSTGMIFGMVSVPLSGLWEASHALGERKVKERIAQNNFHHLSELLLLQMQKAWQDLNDSYKQVRLSEEAKKQAEENLKMNQVSYDNGLSTLTDLLEAQAALQQMNDQLTDAKMNYQMKKSLYFQVTGRYHHAGSNMPAQDETIGLYADISREKPIRIIPTPKGKLITSF